MNLAPTDNLLAIRVGQQVTLRGAFARFLRDGQGTPDGGVLGGCTFRER